MIFPSRRVLWKLLSTPIKAIQFAIKLNKLTAKEKELLRKLGVIK